VREIEQCGEFADNDNLGHLEKLLVSDNSHVKHGKTHLFAKSLFRV
jgi:hypothetical protein